VQAISLLAIELFGAMLVAQRDGQSLFVCVAAKKAVGKGKDGVVPVHKCSEALL
jgi:hypothetical protein